jgi:hypothetical protein
MQTNIICLPLALIGTTVIIRYPKWFGRIPTQLEMIAPQSR